MCPAYEVKVVSVEEFWNNVCPKSEADSTVVFTPALEIESCVVVAVVDNCACCCYCLYFLEFTINWYLQLEPLFQISLRLLLSAWAWFCNWKISLSFLISMMSNSMENCLHLIWVLSGSLTFTSTWFCLYSSSGSFFLLFIHILCFYLNIFVRVWPQEIAKEACVWHICWPHDSSEIIYNSLIDYRRLNLAAAIFFTNILW